MDKIESAVTEIRDRLLLRPPWFVVMIITTLVGACSFLLREVIK